MLITRLFDSKKKSLKLKNKKQNKKILFKLCINVLAYQKKMTLI